MKEQEAVHIALEFWSNRSDRQVEEIISEFRKDRQYWSVILVFDSEYGDDFVVIVVNPETEKAKIFQML